MPAPKVDDHEVFDDEDDVEEVGDDELPAAAPPASGLSRGQLLTSPMLLSSLE